MKLNLNKAKEIEEQGIAVLAGCAYVFNWNLDDAAWEEVERADFTAMRWVPDCQLLTITGPKNKQLLRFAWLDDTRRFLRFRVPAQPPKYASLALLRASAHDPVEFLSSHLSNPVRRYRKPNKKQSGVGLLVGDEATQYCAVVSWNDGVMVVTDVEQRVAGSAGREYTLVEEVDSSEADAVRSKIATVLRDLRPDSAHKFNSNTQLAFGATSSSV
ncbi:MAG: hypothetical protein H3C27_01195 [Opitutaceae bacterium]|nr:hypothetical protein [Opitutaceae bacterium]